MGYTQLGRTGLHVSRLAFGTGPSSAATGDRLRSRMANLGHAPSSVGFGLVVAVGMWALGCLGQNRRRQRVRDR